MKSADQRATGALGLPRHLVLGIDPGVASCGFALIDTENHEILEMGTRLFKQPVKPKDKVSLAAVRRGFRSSRRNLDRTQDRLKHLLDRLQEHGVVPLDATKEYFHTVKGDKPPLVLRAEGLDRLLTPREWALVLYSICKRRGYIPYGASSKDSASDDGKVLKAIAQNKAELEADGVRTVGEWLAKKERSRNSIGSYELCVTHEMLMAEADTLFAAQRSFGSTYAGESLQADFHKECDWQRPTSVFDEHTYALVGSCIYFSNEKRAARCTLTSEMVSALAALKHVRVVNEAGKESPLSPETVEDIMRTLFSPHEIKGNKECKVTYSRLRRLLDLPARAAFKGIRQDDEKNREPFSPKAWRLLRSTLSADGLNLLSRMVDDRDFADAVCEALAYASSEPSLRNRLKQLPLNEAETDALCRVPYGSAVMNGYGTRSKKALDLLFDSLIEDSVESLYKAEEACGLSVKRMAGPDISRADRLAPYESWLGATGRTNNNPVVLRSMAQMRKVINAVCAEWGVPNEIRVEMARELALSKKINQEIEKANSKNKKENERRRASVAELLGCAPELVRLSLVEKYRLWEEQGHFDAYRTDAKIEVERLVQDESYTQIDHILPFSRTGDNSKHNKVLVLSKTNQDKRERTPYEWMNSGEPGVPSWDQFKAHVLEARKLHPRKRSFLLETELAKREPEFLSRNLNDNGYAARELCTYLADCLAFPDDGGRRHVYAVSGRATAWLRHAWGLNFGKTGEKDRADDRHHATDACVIAACSQSLVMRTARYSERREAMSREERDAALREAMPWETFADDVRARRESVVPTRHAQRKGTGEIFRQTVYQYCGLNKQGKHLAKRRSDDEPKVFGNAVVSDDQKSLRDVGDMVCLRLWHDPDVRTKGKNKGKDQWYADPIYCADLPAVKAGTYVPRIARAHTGRDMWAPIPEHVLEGRAVEIYMDDVVKVGDKVGRLSGFDMNSANWSMSDFLTGARIPFSTIDLLGNDLVPQVIREDALGRCWDGLAALDEGAQEE